MRFKGLFVLTILKCLAFLPLGLSRVLGTALGWLSWQANGREAKITIENIRLCYPGLIEREQQRLAKASLIETGKLAFEISSAWFRSANYCYGKIKKIHGERPLKLALANGKGVIILAPHMGNWEFLGRLMTHYAQVTNLYQPPKQSYMEDIMCRQRQQDGATLVPTNVRGVAKLLGALKKGGISGILPDQVPETGGNFAPFFGHAAYTMTLVHGLLLRTGAQVFYAYAERISGGFEVHFCRAPEAIYSDNLQESITAMNEGIEQCVNRCPEQYQWEYKRFKRQPEGCEKRYCFTD